ncbi:5'-AMP-activated protein kinase beta subunit, interation domain-containing protein [Podospora conica]|nr:5'-AMP-activated protein kinase beta subunit, interation domain-containing protein [Schizothecium conicum]
MGNSPSTNRPGQPSPGSHPINQNDPSRPVRRDNNRHPIPVHSRGAAPPEPSLHQAQGTAVQPLPNNNRPKSLPPRAIPTQDNHPSSSMTAPNSVSSSRPLDVRPLASPEPSKPVAVPNQGSHHPTSSRSPDASFGHDITPGAMSSLQDISYLTRPPRLPLPIEEEVHTPGSPIISPTELGDAIEDVQRLDHEIAVRNNLEAEEEDPERLDRPPSSLSESTVDDDEEVDELLVDKSLPKVPTRLEWLRGGDKVYVTGTIFSWNRKTRLRPVEGRPGVLAATIDISPGTHHVRFLVDGQMQTSPDLPTTVDFGNNLVNYIEVSPDDVLSQEPEASGAATANDQAVDPSKPPQSEVEAANETRYRTVLPTSEFAREIPKYLLDLDAPEETQTYQNAIAAIEQLPPPPSLPGFLGKPVLNVTTPLVKDDNSVLTMPNHTMLNHLATSSIKNNILAVSATTRYKSKYVTTIMYKPSTN